MHYISADRFLARLRYQLALGIALVAVGPSVLYHAGNWRALVADEAALNTIAASGIAYLIALLLFRRVITFPGIGVVAHALPADSVGFGVILAVLLGLRLEYSALTLSVSFVACGLVLLLISLSLRTARGRRFYVVPSAATIDFNDRHSLDWNILAEPHLPKGQNYVLIADLRADLAPEWEKLIADAAISGLFVYHLKQIKESITGKVEIEHMSENSFGSLVPNLSYRTLKRLGDIVSVFVLLPFLLSVLAIASIAIKFDSPGPIFFRQVRRGFKGTAFSMIKLRTMTDRLESSIDAREDAVTQVSDKRVTRVGKYLRRTRIDELPQVWNILTGEMSWIGPRPEALPLSDWYAEQLPFYSYRHIVRPGITGWAQVSQGHVADLEAVLEKLHYDFYYIKNFSAWLDLLIVYRTAATVISGFGAR